jgi:hypothetical protein
MYLPVGLPASSGRQVKSYPQPASPSPWFSTHIHPGMNNRPVMVAVLRRQSRPIIINQPWLRRLVAGLSPQKPGFAPVSNHVGFMVDKVALGQTFEFFGFRLSIYSIHLGSPCSFSRGGWIVGPSGRSSETWSRSINMNKVKQILTQLCKDSVS